MAEEKKVNSRGRRGHRGNNRSDRDEKYSKDTDGRRLPKVVMNDPTWYVLHPELLKDVGSLSFANWMGRGLRLGTGVSNNPRSVAILTLPYLYTMGVSSEAQDPVNLAIRNLYTFVRHANSGHTNYESADLGLYLLAVGGVVATLAHIERMLGVAKLYLRRNAAVPLGLLEELGWNNPLTTLIPNLANYTARLNVAWQRVSSLCIPKDFKFIQRWIWMNSQVFKDHESEKAALIAFRPCSVPTFHANLVETGGCIVQDNRHNYIQGDDWFDAVELALGNILQDEDMNIMSGDILKAYGKESLMQFGLTSLDYIVEPVYVEEMLPQVQHAMTSIDIPVGSSPNISNFATGIPYDIANTYSTTINPTATPKLYAQVQIANEFTIYQVNGEIVCCPCDKHSETSATVAGAAPYIVYWEGSSGSDAQTTRPYQRLINSYRELPTPEEVVLASRLMFVEEPETRSSANPLYITSCGTELVTRFELRTVKATLSGTQSEHITVSSDMISGGTGSLGASTYYHQLLLNQIDWAPIIYTIKVAGTISSTNRYPDVSSFSGDIDNFAIITHEEIKRLNLNAVLAEFTVTSMNFIK